MTDTICYSTRAAAARAAITNDFGDGWMSKAARDMIRIAAFAGFDVDEVKRRVILSTHPDRTVNARSVERVMGELTEEWDAAHGVVRPTREEVLASLRSDTEDPS